MKNVLLHPLKEMNNVFEVVVIDLIVVLVEIDKLMIKEIVIVMSKTKKWGRLEEEEIKTLMNRERTTNNDREQVMWKVADVEVW